MSLKTDEGIRLVVTGGGTGGHLFPGIAVAETIMSRLPGSCVLFVTPGRPVDIKGLAGREWQHVVMKGHGLKGTSIGRRLKAIAGLVPAIFRAMAILRDFRPHLVLGVGGYVTGPVLVAARLLGVPSLIHEQNSVPGLANRMLARIVDRILVSMPVAPRYFPFGKTMETGNPVRREFVTKGCASADVNSEKGNDQLAANPGSTQDQGKINDRADANRLHGQTTPAIQKTLKMQKLFVTGGSQGAHRLNTLMCEAVSLLPETMRESLFITHQTGPDDAPMVRAAYEAAGVSARVDPFISDMADCYFAADLVLARAGATTLAEMTVMGKASILIPYPYAADNHQEMNGAHLVAAGAARMFRQDEVTGEKLADELFSLLRDEDLRRKMAAASRAMGKPEAAGVIIDQCLALLQRKSSPIVSGKTCLAL